MAKFKSSGIALMAFGVVVLAISGCQPQGGPGAVQLTPSEVNETFIGRPWHGPSGAFLFRADGTYTYQDFDADIPRGTWDYTMLDDGTLESEYTSYTFFKGPLGYSYYHSRSEQFYTAVPNRPAPFAE